VGVLVEASPQANCDPGQQGRCTEPLELSTMITPHCYDKLRQLVGYRSRHNT
jgi:hypothetical protein